MLGVLWCIYPIIWGLAEGSNTISVTAEVRPASRHGMHMQRVAVFSLYFGSGPRKCQMHEVECIHHTYICAQKAIMIFSEQLVLKPCLPADRLLWCA